MTHNFDSLLAICTSGKNSWGPDRQARGYWVTVGLFPFSANFRAVVDDFGVLTPVARY